MAKTICVKQKHINAGTQKRGSSCPVALAGFKNVWVDAWEINVMNEEEDDFSFASSRSVSRFVNKFDKNGKKAVKPFNFKLQVQE